MEKRYQVFVSSTYEDLKEERRQVNQALLELECLPAAMELFVATDDDQWTLIQEVIDLSDYYIVIVGGRYGSMDAAGISFTEREFDYALEKEIPVLAFVHRTPDNIPVGKTDQDDGARRKLDAFREKVKTGRTVAMFDSPHELGSEVSRALVRLIRRKPGIGWVRGDAVIAEDAEKEILRLRAELAEARENSKMLEPGGTQGLDLTKLASGDDPFNFTLRIRSSAYGDRTDFNVESTVTLNEILSSIGPSLIDEATEREVQTRLEACAYYGEMSDEDRKACSEVSNINYRLYGEQVDQILVHLRTAGVIASGEKKRPVSDSNKYLRLTQLGQSQLSALLALTREDVAVSAESAQPEPVPAPPPRPDA